MKVVISTAPLTTASKTRGVGIYARELIKALDRNYPDDSFITSDKNCYQQGADIVHFPFFDPFFLTLPRKKTLPTIVTIHDVIPLKFPQHFPPGIRGKLKFSRQKSSLLDTTHVITDSQSSKNDISTYLNYPAEKISVVPLGPTTARSTVTLSTTIREEYALPQRYLLYVGDINWNKNVPGLIQAFSSLSSKNIHLVLVGKVFSDRPDIPEYQVVEKSIENSPARNRIKLIGYVPSHHLPYLYQHATLYVQPSWYEGFGLPVLEAMYQGCPVLSSDQGSLPEVGGDAVAYFNPNEPKSLKKNLNELLSNPGKRRQLKKLGLARAKEFSWDLTARLTHTVYEKVLAESRS